MLFKDHLKIVTDAGAVLHLGWDYDMQAENGSGYLQASVSFYPMEAGILPEPL